MLHASGTFIAAEADVNIQVLGFGVAVSDRWLRFNFGCGAAEVSGRGFRDDCVL
jgi:hypothetical protein